MDPTLQWALGAMVAVVLAAFAVPRLVSGARTKDIEQTLTTMKLALDTERDLAKNNAVRFTEELKTEREKRHAQEVRCASEIAELRGQIAAVTGPLAKELVRVVKEVLLGDGD